MQNLPLQGSMTRPAVLAATCCRAARVKGRPKNGMASSRRAPWRKHLGAREATIVRLPTTVNCLMAIQGYAVIQGMRCVCTPACDDRGVHSTPW